MSPEVTDTDTIKIRETLYTREPVPTDIPLIRKPLTDHPHPQAA